MPGVQTVTVDYDAKEALVEFDSAVATIEQMTAALKKENYEGSLKSWPKG